MEIFKKLKSNLNKNETKFYQLPEDSVKLDELKKNREKLENLWDSFKYQLDTINILAPEEITNRSAVLRENIDIVDNNLKELNNPPKYKNYVDKLKKRKNLTLYIDNLKKNKGIDGENFKDEDFMELEDPEMENLRKNKIFWRNLGQMYNKNFERGIKWEEKVNAISKDLEEREKRLKEEKHKEKENNSYDHNQDNNDNGNYGENENEEAVKNHINENDFQDYHEDDNQYDVHEQSEQEIKISATNNNYNDQDNYIIDEDEERELEQKNREIEKNIREMEREKKRLEVSLITPRWKSETLKEKVSTLSKYMMTISKMKDC